MALVDVIMPQLGESIAEGTISKWHKKKGEAIGKDETLLEISTDKVDSEIPSPAAGVVSELLYAEQTTVSVMTVIARIDTEGSALNRGDAAAQSAPGAGVSAGSMLSGAEGVPLAEETSDLPQASITAQVQEAFGGSAQRAEVQAPAAPQEQPAPPTERPHHERGGEGGRFYSPLVLNIARSEQIPFQELDRIEGTGNSGRVTKKDVLSYLDRKNRGEIPAPRPEPSGRPQEELSVAAEGRRRSSVSDAEAPRIQMIDPSRKKAAPAGAREERIPMDTMRRSIADRMVKSKQTSPHVYTVTEADVSKLVAYRERMKGEFERREGFKLTLTPFFLDAVAKALREFPLVNASVEADTVVLKKDIHLGVAVALESGLIVPVIRHADEKNIAGLARAVNDLSTRARSKKLLPEDVQGGTFTVTNPGMVGNLYGIPIINQPQAAILAVGVVKKRPVVEDGAIAIRSMVYLSLSYDHRIIDGLLGGTFLERIVTLLENFNTQLAV